MPRDSDLATRLPDAPPPHPARREAAIDAAMRRFDGLPDAPVEATRPAPSGARGWWARPQFASLASIAVVALVTSSVWLWQGDPLVTQGGAPGARQVPLQDDTAAPPLEAQADRAAEPAPAGGQATPADVSSGVALADDSAARLAEPAPPPAATAAQEAVTVTGSRIQRQDYQTNSPAVAAEQQLNRLPQFSPAPAAPPPPPPPPPPPAPARAQAQAESDSVVVTGSQISRREAPAAAAPVVRPEWNACTLADPARNLAACRALANPADPGAAGRAGAQLADGLTLAWQGETDRAIQAFDRAVAADPDLAIAYLNRGLAYRAQGDLRRARADLDRAVSRSPRDARAYHHRSELRRAAGDAAGAEADARRAAELGG